MINAWVERGRIKASYRVDGKLVIKDLAPAEYVAFVRDADVNHPAIQDALVESIERDFPGWWKLRFPDYDTRKEALLANPSLYYEADVSPVRRFLSDRPCKLEQPRRCYFDLETDSRVPFEAAVKGNTRLLSWAVSDDEGGAWTGVLADDSPQAEAELWAALWARLGDYCQAAAWNGDRFDFAVMKERCLELSKRFPKTMDAYWEHRRRLLFIDQLECFKRHHMAAESGDDKTSFKLNDVCQALLGEGKHDFDSGKTWEAWEAGGAARERLVAYNLQDTALLPKLEKETGYLELQQTLAEVTLTFANSYGLLPSPQIDGYLLRLAHKRKTHLPSKLPGGKGTGQKAAGAFVLKPTELGIHREVHVCDFKSLYPTVIRTFNIGPETKGTGTARCKAFGPEVEFDTSYEGMLAVACREGMELREFFKQEYKKDPNNKSAERKSKAYKIFNNSMYGWLGNPYARFFDIELVESVTQSARALNDATAAAARDRGWSVVYMDTDSLFVKGCSVEEFTAFVKWCNAELYPKVLADRNVPADRNVIALDYEKAFERLVFPLGIEGTPAAKRYLGSYKHYGFKEKKKPEIRGLEYMRADSVRIARRLQKELVDLLLAGQDDPDFFHEWVKRQRAVFFDQVVELDDVVLSKGISRALDAYKTHPPHIRIAMALAEAGEDVSEGTRISYVVTDATKSPTAVIPAGDFDGTNLDRHYYWNKGIYPCLMRVLCGALPNQPWSRWTAKRPQPVAPGQLGLFA